MYHVVITCSIWNLLGFLHATFTDKKSNALALLLKPTKFHKIKPVFITLNTVIFLLLEI